MKAFVQAPRLLTAVGVLCVALSVEAIGAPPILYDGRTLDEWRALIQQIDYQSPSRAAYVPGLRAIVLDVDAPWFTRRQAALTLGRIGEPAETVIPDLIQLLDAPVDPVETSPALWALKALSHFDSRAVEATDAACRILGDPTAPIILRLTATETLGRIGIASNQAIEMLIRGGAGALQTRSGNDQLELRIACIESLQLPAPPSAVPMLIKACSDPAERIRHAAAATLGFLGSRAEPAAEILGSMVVFDETPVVQEAAARSLAKLGDAGIGILTRLLQNDDDEVLQLAIDAAGRTIDRRRELGPALTSLFTSTNPVVAVRSMQAWWLVTREGRPILSGLVNFLSSDDREVRKVASDTLLAMGGAASPVRRELERVMREGSEDARAAAERVVRGLREAASDQ